MAYIYNLSTKTYMHLMKAIAFFNIEKQHKHNRLQQNSGLRAQHHGNSFSSFKAVLKMFLAQKQQIE